MAYQPPQSPEQAREPYQDQQGQQQETPQQESYQGPYQQPPPQPETYQVPYQPPPPQPWETPPERYQGPYQQPPPYQQPGQQYQQPYQPPGYPQPGYPQPGYPAYPQSDKEWLVTLLLCIFVGLLGVHRFYTGHIAIGVIQLLTMGGCGIWTIIDLIMIITGSYKDANGLPLRGRPT